MCKDMKTQVDVEKRREYRRKYMAAYYASRPEAAAIRKERARNYAREYYKRPEVIVRLKSQEFKEKKHEYDSQWGNSIKAKNRKRAFGQTLSGKYLRYKSGAKQRGISFELTSEEFGQFWQKPCHYCGDKISTICLDRVDNSKGYIMGNVVPCCVRHNRMKLTMSVEEFVEACKKVVEHFEGNVNQKQEKLNER